MKQNCSKLYTQIALVAQLSNPIDTYNSEDKGHGRQEFRRVEVFENKLQVDKDWCGIQRLVRVRRWGNRNHQPFEQVSYYILSKRIDDAKQIAQGIRLHWAIENGLHWTKDVLLGEDNMTIVHAKAATTVAHMNTIALNLLRFAGYKPVKDSIAIFANKVKELYNLLALKPGFKRT